MSSSRLMWERDGLNWPHREASRFVQAAGLILIPIRSTINYPIPSGN
jgi:hypothetical protein